MKNLDVKYVLGDAEILNGMQYLESLEIFSEKTYAFLDALSKQIRKHKELYRYPDLAAFGFWCRKKHMIEESAAYDTGVGKGIALHFVPSNIPSLFMYSMTAALLAGNCVVMRLPQKASPLEAIVIQCLQNAMKEMPLFESRIVLLRYGHEKNITDALSKMCDVRVIWGGDASVADIQRSPLRAGVKDITFVDRKSAAVMDAKAVLTCNDLGSLAHEFYKDTYLNDQNACSSPSVICWLGNADEVRQAQKLFWEAVDIIVKERYELPANAAVKKWEQALKTAALQKDIHIVRHDNGIIRIEAKELWTNWWEDTMYCGYFIEYRCTDLNGLEPLLVPKCQTLTCYGLDAQMVRNYTQQVHSQRIDRVVQMGHALDFELVWDGIDLIKNMSNM